MKLLDIAEVARRSGLPASTLRFYEEKGLIDSVGRHGLRRLFGPDVLELVPHRHVELAGDYDPGHVFDGPQPVQREADGHGGVDERSHRSWPDAN